MLHFGLHTIAEKVCSQAMSRIDKLQSSAYAFALVVYRVASRHALLNDLFLGMLYKSCTYCVPMYLARNKYADDAVRLLNPFTMLCFSVSLICVYIESFASSICTFARVLIPSFRCVGV